MKIYSIELDTLPELVQDALQSDQFFEFRYSLQGRYSLSDEQDITLNSVFADLFAKQIDISLLQNVIQERLKCNTETARALTIEILLNAILVFPDYFGDQWKHYRSVYGGSENDMERSLTYAFILSRVEQNLQRGVQRLDTIDYEKEAQNMKRIFREQLIGYLHLPESDVLIALNNLIFALIRKYETFPVDLLQALLDNQEQIGLEKIVRDGVKYDPTPLEWIRDLLTAAGSEEISTLTIVKYITQSPNARKLSDGDRGVIRGLFETYYTLKNFPDSLAKVPPADWMIIPYRVEETVRRVPPTAISTPETSLSFVESVPASRAISQQSATVSASITPPPSIPSPSTSMPISEPSPDLPPAEALPAMPLVISLPSQPPMPPMDYNVLVDEIIKKSGITLADESLVSRLRSLLITRLRNVRNDTQTKLRMLDSTSEGGLGLTEAQADSILKILASISEVSPEQSKEEKVEEGKAVEKKEKTGNEMLVGEAKEEVKEKQKDAERQAQEIKKDEATKSVSAETPKKSEAQKEPTPPSLEIQEVEGVPTIVEQRTIETKISEPSTQPTSVSAPKVAPPPPAMQGKDVKQIPVKMGPSSVGGKVSMSDVKTPPRLMDTVEELRFMTLKDFRRLSPKPEEAIQKIIQKITLLEKESYTRKTAGMEAWKQNEIAKLYLAIGQESFGKGQSIGAVIDKRKNVNQPYLTAEEFDALLDLNEYMRV